MGCYTIIRGSRIYAERNPPVLAIGWFLLGISWWSISQSKWFEEAYTRLDVLAWMVCFIFGIVGTVYILSRIIRFTESMTPKDPPIEPLNDNEMRLVTEMIRRNLGDGN